MGRCDGAGGAAGDGRVIDMRFGSASRWPPRTLAASGEMNRCYRMGKNSPYVDRRTLTGLLLEEFIATRRYVPEGATPIQTPEDLPPQLRRQVQELNGQWQWRAWNSGPRIWFVIAQIVSDPRLESQEQALRVLFFDVDGVVVACADWLRRGLHRWVLYRILDPAHYRDSLGGDIPQQRTSAV